MASVQPRRRLDHVRHPDPVHGDRELASHPAVTGEPLFTIAFRDEHLIVVDKGPGLVVHPARGHREQTLAQLLAPLLAGGEAERAGIVHHLDRDNSWLLDVASSVATPSR